MSFLFKAINTKTIVEISVIVLTTVVTIIDKVNNK